MAERKRSGGRSQSSRSEEEKAQQQEQQEQQEQQQTSDVDAMGQDKRREVVGHSYGPSRRSQLMFFAAVAVVVAVVVGGWTLAVATFDTTPENFPDKAPWSAGDSELSPTNSPSGPCGEPGNAYPPPADSPCAAQTSAKSTEREPTSPGTGSEEQGAGGSVGGSESRAAAN